MGTDEEPPIDVREGKRKRIVRVSTEWKIGAGDEQPILSTRYFIGLGSPHLNH